VYQFGLLSGALREALRCSDAGLLGYVATTSSTINEQFLPKLMFREILALSNHADALGVAAAHSGTLLSILFDARDPQLEKRIELMRTQLLQIGITDVLRFQT
jgi:uncharacterized protein involved in propanediol utilization